MMRRLRRQENPSSSSPKDSAESAKKSQNASGKRSPGGKEKGKKVEEEFRVVVGLARDDGGGVCCSTTCRQKLEKLIKRCIYLGLTVLLLWVGLPIIRARKSSRRRRSLSVNNFLNNLNPFTRPRTFQNFTVSVLTQGETNEESFKETFSGKFNPFLGRKLPKDLRVGLADMSRTYNPKHEVPFFWDVHFSGATVVRNVLTQCYTTVQANENGMRQPNYNDEKLEVFETDQRHLLVNVDTTSLSGILRARHLHLASSGLADVMISPRLHEFVSNIFDSNHKGRLFTMLRHPVERSISLYYYLGFASWDPMYNPDIANMTLMEYAQSGYLEHNWVTRFLVNKPGGELEKTDMVVAKEILRSKCLVGIFDEMESSVARFAAYFDWSHEGATDSEATACQKAVVQAGDKRHDHPPIKQSHRAWQAIANANKYDLELYEYAKRLFRHQGEQIFHDVTAPNKDSQAKSTRG